jgi:proteasome lid subunit RPN8/RPN11
MEDNNIIKSVSISEIKDFIINNSFLNMSMEICGLLGFDNESQQYIAKIEKNESPDPKNLFILNPMAYLDFKNKYSLIGVFHSHVICDENPSEFDIKMSESTCLPFVIFSINSKKFHIYEPQNKDYDVNIVERLKAKLI